MYDKTRKPKSMHEMTFATHFTVLPKCEIWIFKKKLLGGTCFFKCF